MSDFTKALTCRVRVLTNLRNAVATVFLALVGACQAPGAEEQPFLDAALNQAVARDLATYFSEQGVKEAEVSYVLLRPGPTVTGNSFPKYYLWVEVSAADGQTIAGAVRLAEVRREKFQVTDFVSREAIAEAPQRLDAVFPAALTPMIFHHAEQP